jgi:hypothetical protein
VKMARETVEIIRTVELRNLRKRGGFCLASSVEMMYDILDPVEGPLLRWVLLQSHKPESIERNGVEDFYSVITVAVNRLRTQGCGGFCNVDTTRRFRIEALAVTSKVILRTVEEMRP